MSDFCPRPISIVPGAVHPADEAAASADLDLVALAEEAKRIDLALRALLGGDRRDTDEIPGFDDLADTLAVLVDRVCAARASSLAGIIAKASLSAHFGQSDGDRDARLALSVVRDLLALSGKLKT